MRLAVVKACKGTRKPLRARRNAISIVSSHLLSRASENACIILALFCCVFCECFSILDCALASSLCRADVFFAPAQKKQHSFTRYIENPFSITSPTLSLSAAKKRPSFGGTSDIRSAVACPSRAWSVEFRQHR